MTNENVSMLEKVRRARVVSRCVLLFTLLSFCSVDVAWANAQGQANGAALPQVTRAKHQVHNFSEALQEFKESVDARKGVVEKVARERSGIVDRALNLLGLSRLGAENIDDVLQNADALKTWQLQQRDEFAATAKRIRLKKLPAIALQRHQQAMASANAGYQKTATLINKVRFAKSLRNQVVALDNLNAFLQGEQFTRKQEPFDPNAPLPFGPGEKARQRAPDKVHDPVTAMMTPAQRLETQTEKALAKISDAVINPAYAAPADYLGESLEVTLTPAIRAKAAELHNSPVEIYNWVRNNVEWTPTYGSLQDADATLATQRGNAFAISSLLIALLRAANVPARYAYGVIEVPAVKVQNWVGGTTTPDAALALLGQAGIPAKGLVAGGQVAAIEMEHIWVEAYVDFVPTRAAKNISPDTWVALDASYKQYDYAQGMNLATAVPFDAQGLLTDLQATANSNESEGWVQNVDQTLIQQRFDQYKTQVETYINSQNPNATVGQVLGTRNTIVFEPMQLMSGLPYSSATTTARYAEIPQSLRHTYTVTLAEQTPIAIANETKIINVTMPLIRAANSAVAMSFVPATAQDEQVLLSYLPQTQQGQAIDPNSLPTSLPGYLIHVKAQLTLDGEVIAEGGDFPLGTQLEIAHGFTDPARPIPMTPSVIVAGEYFAIGVDSGTINPNLLDKTKAQLEQAKTELEAIKAQIDAGQTPTISAFLTKHILTGNLLQTGILGYFTINDALDQFDAKSSGVITHRLPSFGTFSTSLQPTYLYGSIPQSVKLSGVAIDVDRIFTLASSKDTDARKSVTFFRATGPRKSAFEHLVLEQLFSTTENPAEAVSAVKALAMAAQQGQKIYTLTSANASQLGSLTISAEAKQDISNAINAGKEVTVHQAQITYAGWTGEGYAVIDPETGAGAWKISGGDNGGKETLENAQKNTYLSAGFTISPDSDAATYFSIFFSTLGGVLEKSIVGVSSTVLGFALDVLQLGLLFNKIVAFCKNTIDALNLIFGLIYSLVLAVCVAVVLAAILSPLIALGGGLGAIIVFGISAAASSLVLNQLVKLDDYLIDITCIRR